MLRFAWSLPPPAGHLLMKLWKPCLIKVTREEFELVNLKEVGRVVCDVSPATSDSDHPFACW